MNSAALRTLLLYAIILPLAVFIGWTVSDMTSASWTMIGVSIFVLLLPVLLKWHYPILLFCWNAGITLFFLPGQPALWMLMAGITFGMAILQRMMQKRRAFLPAHSVTLSLIALALVVLVTAKIRGGIGMRVLGSSVYGGKDYVFLIAGIVGYFALVSQPIPVDRAKRYLGLYFLSGLIPALSSLIYLAGPAFYVLYLIFPAGYASFQAISEYSGPIVRWAGFLPAANGVLFYFFAVHGIQGVFAKWWRPLLLLCFLAFGSLAGFRSLLLVAGLIFVILFLAEGLLRSWIFPVTLACGLVGLAVLVPFASKLPLAAQRTLSFLPVKVDMAAKLDAEASLEWRLEMWRVMIPELPKYMWLGKGYVIDPKDLYLTQESFRRGFARSYEGAIVAGNYHNGPLSVYVPFGSFGCLAVLAFFFTSIRALYSNYRYGNDELRTINRFLFALFLAKVIVFFVMFGAISTEMSHFAGIIGLGVALNRGICRRPAAVPQQQPVRNSLGSATPEPGMA